MVKKDHVGSREGVFLGAAAGVEDGALVEDRSPLCVGERRRPAPGEQSPACGTVEDGEESLREVERDRGDRCGEGDNQGHGLGE
jgi:hypothetical protein